MRTLEKYRNSRLLKNLGIVFSESIATKALNFVVILLLSRHLGAGDYGKYSYIFVAIAFCSAFFDFGMENTAVRFSSKDKPSLNGIFGLYVIVKLIIMLLFVLVLVLFGEEIFELLGQQEITEYIPYLIIGFIGESLLFVNDTYLQAVQRFQLRALINIYRYIVLVACVILLLFSGALLLQYALLLYLIPVMFSLAFLPKYVLLVRSFLDRRLTAVQLKEMLGYQKWMLMVSIPTNTLGRIDFFMISLWVSYEQIGIYNAAFQLSAIVSFIPFAFGKVMLPKMSELEEDKVMAYTNKVMKATAAISLVMICCIPLVNVVVPWILGSEYLDSIPVLQVMLLSAILVFAITPVEQAIYSLGKPGFITVGKYIQIAAIVLLIYATVPYLGVVWAAISVAAARLIYGLILMLLYLNYRKNRLRPVTT
ncbi:lipopolysaccharide biosynthesis protein [Paenibacillus mucilaginosus]|uniref:lipopolysaccharide biosynthesis protein n=1 Tax=Paenibacillus mucilaginosus TaxID=61624 RepID=UPI0005A024AF|nr:oligosaccharide flippase family protein [Paenibacillus mucilaginosus]MCG7214645.1 oligosaccharide flippase family protein [Paenibacillus mucilaginosus]WDM28494.1 oligosaccharide flippase family protein [Paenibacillus mucilaginosus]